MPKKRLLIIEDDIDVAEMLVTYFEAQGFEVINAQEGAEGIALSRAKFPNLILLDVMLPDMDGFDVCKTLRTTTLTKYIPITFLTQRDNRADKVAGLELGADDYVTKPFDVEELRLRIQGSIRRATRDHLHEARTGLPSGPLIKAVLDELVADPGWHYLDVMLRGFTTFREVYSFLPADEALGLAAQTLTEAVITHGTPHDFIGTPDEAHFVVLTFAHDIDSLIAAVTEQFAEQVKTVYNFVDAERGYILLHPNTDSERQEPLMSLDIQHIEREYLFC
ncbi:MAG: response regulator transcription factor [Anaerolineae bacterium]|nr:response regulator transcription factor [Anaerolineae bacterium]